MYDCTWFYFALPGAFEDDDVTHVEGEVNPVRDLEIISEELRLKDQQYLTHRIVCQAGCHYFHTIMQLNSVVRRDNYYYLSRLASVFTGFEIY